jgi:endoglucanase
MQKLLSITGLSALFQVAYTQVTCSGNFTPITAEDFVAKIHPGWNLGNTLDAIPDEGSWNNAPVEAATLDLIKQSGFKSVRLPGTDIISHSMYSILTLCSDLDPSFHWRIP